MQLKYEDLDEQDKKTIAACKEVLRLTSENRGLQDHLDLMIDDFERIKGLLSSYPVLSESGGIRLIKHTPGDEILQLCDRAITNTKQRVPVIAQRDELKKAFDSLEADYARLAERCAQIEEENESLKGPKR